MLIFTQFTEEVITHLVDLLAEIFSQLALVIDGSVSVARELPLSKSFRRLMYNIWSSRSGWKAQD